MIRPHMNSQPLQDLIVSANYILYRTSVILVNIINPNVRECMKQCLIVITTIQVCIALGDNSNPYKSI